MTLESLTLSLQFAAFVWGASWGSFLNVVIYRLPEDLSVVQPGSHCPVCKAPVRWYDNIPCLSYLILRGRCRDCGAQFSIGYALIELACGLLALAMFRAVVLPLGGEHLMTDLAIWVWLQVFVYGMVAITFIDLKHLFIPDEISLGVIVIGLAGAFLLLDERPTGLFFVEDGVTALIGAGVGIGFMLFVSGIGWLIYRREAMGLGDAKLMGALGAFLGYRAIPFILFASAVQALAAVVLSGVAQRITGQETGLTMSTEELDEHFGETDRYADRDLESRTVIPYGPFLALSGLEALFFGPDLVWAIADWLAGLLVSV